MIMRALKFVRHEKIEDHFRQGWLMAFPNAAMHHHHYGCELAWICECPVPGGFSDPAATQLAHDVGELAGEMGRGR